MHLLYPLFSLEKKRYINFVPKSVRHPSATFLVNVSPPKPLDLAILNFVATFCFGVAVTLTSGLSLKKIIKHGLPSVVK